MTITHSDSTVYCRNGSLCRTVYPKQLGLNVVSKWWTRHLATGQWRDKNVVFFFCNVSFMHQVLFTVFVKRNWWFVLSVCVCGSDRETSNQKGNAEMPHLKKEISFFHFVTLCDLLWVCVPIVFMENFWWFLFVKFVVSYQRGSAPSRLVSLKPQQFESKRRLKSPFVLQV